MPSAMEPNTGAESAALSRRAFLSGSGVALGAMALSELEAAAAPRAVQARGPHHRVRAKSIIYLHMAGAPPQQDTLDYKPKLQELHGTLCPKSFIEGKRLAFIKGHPTLLGSPHGFHRCGQQGLMISDLMPNFGQLVDEVTIINSLYTDQFNHAPADLRLYTGNQNFGAASMGAWVSWGLGSLNRDLPSFVVMVSGGSDPTGGKSTWGSGFLPASHQGVRLRGAGDPILYVSDPGGMDRRLRRRILDSVRAINEERLAEGHAPETEARISQYELAYRMQASVPEVMDISQEGPSTLELYGAQPGQASFANNCLLARRLVESGVRWVQLYDWGWDLHGTGPHDDLITSFPQKCQQTDQAVAALLSDLRRRGLLDETLVVWGGEFGRTCMNEARGGSRYWGRDHHPDCFSIWMAGAGIHRGRIVGRTDELGYTIEEGAMSIHDLQDTIMYLMGLDTRRLRYPYQGLDQRLIPVTDTSEVQHHLFS